MPLAILIADRGDARDAVGLFLAGRGWTTLPVDPDPVAVAGAVRAGDPGIVAVDFRGRVAEVEACLPVLAPLGDRVHLLNIPAEHRATVLAALASAMEVTEGAQVPRAPGAPAPPHA